MNPVIRAAGATVNARGRSKGTFTGSSAPIMRFKLVSWFADTRKQATLSGKL